MVAGGTQGDVQAASALSPARRVGSGWCACRLPRSSAVSIRSTTCLSRVPELTAGRVQCQLDRRDPSVSAASRVPCDGPNGHRDASSDPPCSSRTDAVASDRADLDGVIEARALCASRQATIAGGTHQIQRNLLAERVVDLPRQ